MLKTTIFRHIALGSTLMLGMTAAVLAQSANGSIQGTVLDPSGALIPQAQVTISNTDGFSRTIQSDATGGFELAALAPGSYSINIDATGFTPTLEGGVKVAADRVTLENIKLGISVAQEIDVTASDDVALGK